MEIALNDSNFQVNHKINTEKVKENITEVIKTTRLIIYCFAGVTILVAIILTIFYRFRKNAEKQAIYR